MSKGISYVLVAGAIAKDPSGVKRDSRGGRAITGQPA
jgi:hypothetical protein